MTDNHLVTHDALTKPGREPGVTLVLCGWCGHGLLGIIQAK